MSVSRRTGKGASLTLNGNVINITKCSPTFKKEMAKSTDSGDYDPTTDTLYTTQQPGEVSVEMKIEGNVDLSSTTANVINLLILGPAAVPGQLYYTPTQKLLDGHWDISDFEPQIEVGSTMLTFSATAMSNGKFTAS